MKIKVTKTMTKALNKFAKARDLAARFEVVEYNEYMYSCFVSADLLEAADYGDYDSATETYRAIKVNFPPDWEVCGTCITTRDLIRTFDKGDNWETYAQRVMDYYAFI